MWITTLSIRTALALQAVFVAVGFMMMALGSTQPMNSALRGFAEGCEGIPQPCWYGIVPGMARLDAIHTLTNLGYQLDTTYPHDFRYNLTPFIAQTPCRIALFLYFSDHSVRTLTVIWDSECGIRTGDILMTLGTPIGARGNSQEGVFTFQGNEGILETTGFSVMSCLRRVIFVHGNDFSGCVYPLWHGFAAGWYYQQLMPDYVLGVCGA